MTTASTRCVCVLRSAAVAYLLCIIGFAGPPAQTERKGREVHGRHRTGVYWNLEAIKSTTTGVYRLTSFRLTFLLLTMHVLI